MLSMLNPVIAARSAGFSARSCFFSVSLLASAALAAPVSAASAPFDSTADTAFDIIRTDDPTAFVCMTYEGRTVRQMWDKRKDNEFDLNVFLFRAYFNDGPAIDIIVNPEFETREAAEAEARRYTTGLGQLPMVLRQGIRQFGIHDGDPTYSAGTGKIFVYAGRTTRRIGQNHLEESLLHESVHASLDARYRLSPEWKAAQQQDGAFVTDYAERSPDREDLAETMLFAYAFQYHPDRFPPVDSEVVRATIPARLDFLSKLLSSPADTAPVPAPPDDCR